MTGKWREDEDEVGGKELTRGETKMVSSRQRQRWVVVGKRTGWDGVVVLLWSREGGARGLAVDTAGWADVEKDAEGGRSEIGIGRVKILMDALPKVRTKSESKTTRTVSFIYTWRTRSICVHIIRFLNGTERTCGTCGSCSSYITPPVRVSYSHTFPTLSPVARTWPKSKRGSPCVGNSVKTTNASFSGCVVSRASIIVVRIPLTSHSLLVQLTVSSRTNRHTLDLKHMLLALHSLYPH